MAGTLPMTSTAVLSAKVAVMYSGEVGRSAVYSRYNMALGHFLWMRQRWLGRVLRTQFQLLQGSVSYANRVLEQGNHSEGETILTCIGVQYAILCWRLERCLKMLQNSIACFQELPSVIRTIRCVCSIVECLCLKLNWWLGINLLFPTIERSLFKRTIRCSG
jgi:hypothetical protein